MIEDQLICGRESEVFSLARHYDEKKISRNAVAAGQTVEALLGESWILPTCRVFGGRLRIPPRLYLNFDLREADGVLLAWMRDLEVDSGAIGRQPAALQSRRSREDLNETFSVPALMVVLVETLAARKQVDGS
jgi:hypothetical protein